MARGRILRRIALEVLGPERAKLVWSRIDVIGDIALLKKPLNNSIGEEELRVVAERLLKEVSSIRSVWLAVTPVEGPYKTRRLVHLAGEKRTTTIYREHGCSFKVDVSKVFMTPRLSYERLRIARMVREGERVLNMFAGVGTFSIIIAKLSKPFRVYSIDINEHAYRLMVDNIRLNKVEGVIEPYLGDAARVVEERLIGSSTRVLMPLPDLALEYVEYALKALAGGRGWIHVYLHLNSDDPTSRAEEMVRERVSEYSWNIISSQSRIVRSVGPRLYQVVVDALVEGPSG